MILNPESDQWHWHRRIGRAQIGLRVYRHRGVLPDRWVVQPRFIYDRKH